MGLLLASWATAVVAGGLIVSCLSCTKVTYVGGAQWTWLEICVMLTAAIIACVAVGCHIDPEWCQPALCVPLEGRQAANRLPGTAIKPVLGTWVES
jgi:hypothetical protein